MQLHKNTTAEIACSCGNCSEQETLVDHYSEFGDLTHPTLPLIWIDEGVDSMKYFPMEQIFLQFPPPEEPQPRHNPWERLLPEPEYIPFHREQLVRLNSSETESDEIEEDGEAGMEENGYEAAPDQIASEHLEKSELDELLSWIQTYGDSESDERNAPRGGLDSEAADVLEKFDDFLHEQSSGESLRTAKWNVKMTLRSHLDSIRAMQFHPVEPVLITAGEDGTAKLWNLDGTKEKSARSIDAGHHGSPGPSSGEPSFGHAHSAEINFPFLQHIAFGFDGGTPGSTGRGRSFSQGGNDLCVQSRAGRRECAARLAVNVAKRGLSSTPRNHRVRFCRRGNHLTWMSQNLSEMIDNTEQGIFLITLVKNLNVKVSLMELIIILVILFMFFISYLAAKLIMNAKRSSGGGVGGGGGGPPPILRPTDVIVPAFLSTYSTHSKRHHQ
ncbi:unnamed protein product [Cylicocyclus nassatus]|uniref:Uncharacterized protein n=1 Tax=Cylicocyclus nassatus TaxID=53992 RepID=A0AA36M1B6_CYLNA|nr:unnamed protein product [Cylicocyclus nassatus]